MSFKSPERNSLDLGPQSASSRPTLVHNETDWQKPAEPPILANGKSGQISLARWSRARLDDPLEVINERDEHFHFITYSMIQSDINFSVGHTDVTTGVVVPRLVLLQGPTAARRYGIFRKPFDFFRIYFPQNMLAECYEAAFGRPPAEELVLFGPCFNNDGVIEDLTRSLIDVDNSGGAFGPSYVEAVGLAIAFRLLKQYATPRARRSGKVAVPLPKWRLKRVIEYIEARLTEPIYLSELGEVAGLSRMHFAAQFRAAIGCSPTVYIARRRIAFAQRLLLDLSLSISDIARSIGFSNQAQFTAIFRKVVGTSPQQWRNAMMGA